MTTRYKVILVFWQTCQNNIKNQLCCFAVALPRETGEMRSGGGVKTIELTSIKLFYVVRVVFLIPYLLTIKT